MNLTRLIPSLIVLCILLITITVQGKKSSSSSKKSALCNEDFFSQYHSSSDLFGFLDACTEKFGALSHTIGKSAEGKSLKVITIGNGPREIFVMAGLHGREWIAPASTAWAFYEIMRKASEGDVQMVSFLEQNKVHVLALINPDGYDYSRTKSETQDRRQWRKNRRLLPCKGERCAHGVDLNRNWGIEGKTFGFGATRPTSDVFQGKRPFSEPEIRAIRDWLLENGRGKHIDFVLDIHCCAQTILPPSYYHDESTALKTEHLAIARRVSHAMTAVNQEQYGSRQREQEFSATNSGISVDWIYGEGGVGLALIVETRGNEKNRKLENIFDVDPRNIGPIGGEVLAAILAVSKENLPNRAQAAATVAKVESSASESPVAEASNELNQPSRASVAAAFTPLPSKPVRTTEQPTYSVPTHSEIEEDEEEEPAPAPLIVEPVTDIEDAGPPPPPPMDEEPPPAPDAPPLAENDDDIEARHAASRLRRHKKYHITEDASPPASDTDEGGAPVSPPSEEDDIVAVEGESHVESFHPKQSDPVRKFSASSGQLKRVDTAGEELEEETQELDAEIQVILSEVESEQKPDQNGDGAKPLGGIEDNGSEDGSLSVSDEDNPESATADSATSDDIKTVQEKRIFKHDEGLLIIDEDDDDRLQDEVRQEEETEQITRRLRARINQLRAIRQANPQSKWTAFKSKLRKGKWRAPLAFAFAVFVLWHFATKKNRVRRDD